MIQLGSKKQSFVAVTALMAFLALPACSKSTKFNNVDGTDGSGFIGGDGGGGGGDTESYSPGVGSRGFSCNEKTESLVPFAHGDGTAENPFKICSANQFVEIANRCGTTWTNFCDSHYSLEKNIDLASVNLKPIGAMITNSTTTTTGTKGFNGVFSGNSYELKNISISGDERNRGLFSFLGPNAKVSGLKATVIKIKGSAIVGGIAGMNLGVITKCSVIGVKALGFHLSATTSEGIIGGIAGINGGTISQSYADLRIRADQELGGIAGRSYKYSDLPNPVIENSYSKGYFEGNSSTGGIVGKNYAWHHQFRNNYSIANAQANIQWHPLIGLDRKEVPIGNFYEIGNGEQPNNSGKYFYDLTKKETFTNWDFDSIWAMPDDGDTPIHQWNTQNAELSLHPLIKNGRKISLNDQADFKIWGFCQVPNKKISVSGDTNAETICGGGTWSMDLDFSEKPDGPINILITSLPAQPIARTFNKETNFCKQYMEIESVADVNVNVNNGRYFYICTEQQFQSLPQAIMDSSSLKAGDEIRLANNLNFEGQSINEGIQPFKFQHKFDGQGFRISNFVSSLPLFPEINIEHSFPEMGYAVRGVFNLGVENSRVISSTDYTGGLIGNTTGDLVNSYFEGVVSSGGTYTGGLVGSMRPGDDCDFSSRLENSFFIGSVHGQRITGGLIGQLKNSEPYSPPAEDSIPAGDEEDNSENDECSSHRQDSFFHSTLSNSFAFGSVKGSRQVGGVVGSSNSNIDSVSFQGRVEGDESAVGGILGEFTSDKLTGTYVYPSEIESSNYFKNSTFIGLVSAVTEVGGTVGLVQAPFAQTISNHFSDGWVIGHGNVGGVVGQDQEGEIPMESEMNPSDTSYHQSRYTRLSSSSDVVATAFDGNNGSDVGGIIGCGIAIVSHSKSNSKVYGVSSVGGIYGQLNSHVSFEAGSPCTPIDPSASPEPEPNFQVQREECASVGEEFENETEASFAVQACETGVDEAQNQWNQTQQANQEFQNQNACKPDSDVPDDIMAGFGDGVKFTGSVETGLGMNGGPIAGYVKPGLDQPNGNGPHKGMWDPALVEIINTNNNYGTQTDLSREVFMPE